QGDIGRRFSSHRTNGGGYFSFVGEIHWAKSKCGEQFGNVNPARVGVVIAQGEFDLLFGQRQAFHESHAAVDASQSAAAIFNASRDHFKGQTSAALDVQPQPCRIGIRSQGIDVVEQQVLELRSCGQQTRENAVPQQVGNFVPMAHRV